MQNCFGKSNLIYFLIYLDVIIIFSQMAEEHLHGLCMVLDQFREYNLKLKPSKCSLFKEEINYLVHWVSKEDVQPSNSNLRATAKCAPSPTYMEIQVFLGLMGHYQWFIKGFTCIAQPLNWLLSGKAPVGNQRGCHYWRMPWEPSILCNRHAWVFQSWPSTIIPKNSY